MSTDLHLHRDLPKLRISTVEIPVPYSDDKNGAVLAAPSQSEVTETEDGCRTPTSKESRIPEILSCPPAPRKPKRLVSCKRKLADEFQFFEVVNKEEIDAFFRSVASKRSCRCI
ncbi:hypothetical protein L6164_006881 [Bauhinia variegata]|uniref:Uncharacterized protein n=1 Tax=Bauhinia variegata TaxID=167791 RepID=A0ACB9PWC5_BAUVA|nr:hypothetical protein L6164_006881 [Bauhinia variegata]